MSALLLTPHPAKRASVAASIERYGPAAALIAIVFVAYAHVSDAGFIWDDEQHLTENPCVVGPLGLKEIWTTARAVYYPLVLTTFWGLHKIVGLNPAPYHLLNVLLHALAAALLWRVLRALNVRGAWIGAALWAVHPVMVQSVAWITELKNTQSAVFFLLSILCYLKIDNARSAASRISAFALALLLFVGALTSKPSTVVLPIVLGLCVWWRDQRVRGRDIARLTPFFLLSAIASAWTIWEQKFHAHAIGSDWSESLGQRLIIAGRALWFYLGKLIWPVHLTFIYPRWQVDASRPIEYLPLTAVIAVLFSVWLARRTTLRPAFVVLVYFAACLFPVLGFFTIYFFRYSFVSDHFQYVASMGPMALAGAGLASAIPFIRWKLVGAAAVGIILVTLTALSWRQTAVYRDVFTLYEDTLQKNPDCWMAHYNLGIALRGRGDTEAAVSHYRQAIALRKNYVEAHFNLARILVDRGQYDEAAAHYEEVLKSDAQDVEALNNLANTFERLGRADEAIALYERALTIRPDYSEATINLANALLARGETDRAIRYYTAGLTISPNYPQAQYNLANALLRIGRTAEAIAHYRVAASLEPSNADIRANLGSALLRSGDLAGAIAEYRAALSIAPNNLPAQTNLAWMLATSNDDSIRNGAEAIALAENANRITGGKAAAVLRVLAAACAENGRFAEAVATAERARDVAVREGNETITRSLDRELALYRAGTRNHQAPR